MHYGFSQTNERLVAQIFRQDELYDIWAKQNSMKPSTVTVLYLLDQFEDDTQG